MKYLQAVLVVGLVFVISFLTPRTDFFQLFGLYSLLFGLFLWIYIKSNDHSDILFFSAVGIAARLVAVFAFPNLSDDIYRFFWDGQLFAQGLNPFELLPSEYVKELADDSYLKSQIYPYLNSPNYYTIYPPISQWIYSLSAFLFPKSIYGAAIFLGMILLIAEIGTIYLLLKLLPLAKIHQKHVLIYALNPLIILETCGNLHFEGLMLFFFLSAYWMLQRRLYWLFGLCFAFSILTKLFTLCLFPLFIRKLGFKRFLFQGVYISLICLLCFAPFITESFIENFSSSLDLYMRKFEFNGSMYYLARKVGFEITGYNQIAKIGPILALSFVFLAMLTYILQFVNDRGLMYRAMLIWTSYLILGTIVHPWYLIGILTLGAFTNFKYPIVWSYLIFLTYAAYAANPYKENMALLIAEYAILFLFILVDFGILFPKIKEKILS